nr:hypothetical protein Iba_chr13fCG6890 [Ipomoea batatas]
MDIAVEPSSERHATSNGDDGKLSSSLLSLFFDGDDGIVAGDLHGSSQADPVSGVLFFSQWCAAAVASGASLLGGGDEDKALFRLRRPSIRRRCPERCTERETKVTSVAVVGQTEDNAGDVKAAKGRGTPSKVRRRCFCRRIRSLETPLPHDVDAGREKERARRGAGCLAPSEATAPTPLLHCRGDKFPPSSVALQMKEKGSVRKREPLAGIGEESCSLLTGILRWPLL